jgi:threonine aldolase
MLVDLRSDTVTRPTPAMREAMARAEVGDDVFGEDPTVRALEEEVASLLGKEAALFVSSGTMGNQLAIALHTRPGDEVIVGEGAHAAWYESGAAPVLSGVQFAVAGRGGLFGPEDVDAAMKPRAYWCPRSSLVCVENTHNRAGGRVFPPRLVEAIAARARAHGLALHLDGARLWNAAVAIGSSVAALAEPFDTVSVCFSKGLGAPVGSALAGSREAIERARRLRKMWGGGMRQVGVLAAAARHALSHHVARLADDHASARRFAERMARCPRARVDLDSVETNIVNVDLVGVDAESAVRAGRDAGVLVNATGPTRLRAVTHMDAPMDAVVAGAERLAAALEALP